MREFRTRAESLQLRSSHRLTGGCFWPEVGLEEIITDLPEATD